MTLRIKEIRKDNNLIKYSYYFLNTNNELIFGWDNAPHHEDINSFPHHKHIKEQKNIKKSSVRNLNDVFKKLKEYYKQINMI